MTLVRDLVALLMLAGLPTAAHAEDYLSAPGLRAHVLEMLFDRVGDDAPLAGLTLRADSVTMRVAGDQRADFYDWRVERLMVGPAGFDIAGGPAAAVDTGPVKRRDDALFGRAEAGLGNIDRAVGNAEAFAGMKLPATVESIEIARSVSILPTPAYGAVHMTIRLVAGRETAVVDTDAAGRVVGGDLSDTDQAREADYIGRNDWPMAAAQSALESAIGIAPVHLVRINENHVFVTADHPTDKALARDYRWNYAGVTQGMIDAPNAMSMGVGGHERFALSDIDLTRLPQIKAAALAAFGSEGAVVTGIEANKPTDRPAAPMVLWQVDLRQADGETGSVLLDVAGKVIELHLPASRAPAAEPWLAPAMVALTLTRIADTFGPDARISSIVIDDAHATLQVEDPAAPGRLAQFIMDYRYISRFGSPSAFASLAEGQAFTPRDLAPLGAERLAELGERTLKRIGVADADVSSFTISRGAVMTTSDGGRLLVEVRVSDADGNRSGWVTYRLDGTEVEAVLP